MIYLDCETIGLCGPIVLFQYAVDDGPIQLYNPWHNTVEETIDLLEMVANHRDGIVGFNLVFDWFKIYQMWTVLKLLPNPNDLLEDYIDEYAELEPKARQYHYCLKPARACDLMLHARKGPYQSTMDRSDIRIRRVPYLIANDVRRELEQRIQLRKLYFARRKDKNRDMWQVFETDDDDFRDVVLKFAPSSALKVLAVDALGIDENEIFYFHDVELPKKFQPKEVGYAPYAMALGSPADWKGTWPDVIRHHIAHWSTNTDARKYATSDVDYTRRLYYYFDRPEPGDNDSELACAVGCCRWRGYRVDVEGLKDLRTKAIAKKTKNGFKVPIAPKQASSYLKHGLSEAEAAALGNTTKKIFLEKVAKGAILELTKDCECTISAIDGSLSYAQQLAALLEAKDPDPDCPLCEGQGSVPHPVATKAQEILDARQADKERELYDKLILAGGILHASFKIIGSLSSRMAGADKLNPQGIKKTYYVRSKFPLAFEPYILCGGDFAGFEVALAEAVYKDPKLREDLLSKRPCHKCKGKKLAPQHQCKQDKCKICLGNGICKECNGVGELPTSIHALFGTCVYPDMTYDEILNTKGTSDDRYTRAKSALFAMLYGGEGKTLQDRLGVDIETANKAYQLFIQRYTEVGRRRQETIDRFCSMRQPGGIGTKVEWHEPAEYATSPAGFRRYFTLENRICKVLFDLANNPPKEWFKKKIKVHRRDREQTVHGAAQSALYACAFSMQASNVRAGVNHEIQSYGALITKDLQRSIWNLQPVGAHKWLVQPLNIHDEVLCPVHPSMVERVKQIVQDKVESYRPAVPLIEMEWKAGIGNWAEK